MRTLGLYGCDAFDLVSALEASPHPAAPRFVARVRQALRIYTGADNDLPCERGDVPQIEEWVSRSVPPANPELPSGCVTQRVQDSSFTFPVEGHDGTMREYRIGDFHSTGVARDWPDAKAEVAQCGHTMGLSIVGYFRTPQGHLAEASRFQHYLDLERAAGVE